MKNQSTNSTQEHIPTTANNAPTTAQSSGTQVVTFIIPQSPLTAQLMRDLALSVRV